MRIVQQLVESIARLLELGTPAAKQEAIALLDEAAHQSLGLELSFLANLSVANLALVLSRPESLAVYAELLVAQATINAENADALRSRAREILALAIAHGSREPDKLRKRLEDIR